MKVTQSYLALQPHGLYSPWDSPGQNTGAGSLSPLQGIFPTQGLNPALLTLQADSLSAEPQGKPKNIGVGSLSLLQWVFPTQESNQGLLHCRWLLYQLSYKGKSTILQLKLFLKSEWQDHTGGKSACFYKISFPWQHTSSYINREYSALIKSRSCL